MVAAVEVVVDEHLPVAVEDVVPAVEPVQVRQAELRDLRDDLGAQELLERGALGRDPHEHPVLPRRGRHRHEPVPGRVEVPHALEGGRRLERALERVGPAVVRAAQTLQAACGPGDHRGGVVAADVEEAAQDAVVAAHHHQRLAGEFERDELAGLAHLVDPAGVLPALREHGALLQLEEPRFHVPRCRRRAGFLERQPGTVAVDLLEDGVLHDGGGGPRATRPLRLVGLRGSAASSRSISASDSVVLGCRCSTSAQFRRAALNPGAARASPGCDSSSEPACLSATSRVPTGSGETLIRRAAFRQSRERMKDPRLPACQSVCPCSTAAQLRAAQVRRRAGLRVGAVPGEGAAAAAGACGAGLGGAEGTRVARGAV